MKYSFEAIVLKVYQPFENSNWFIKFHNWVSISVGEDLPDVKPGDKIIITLEKVNSDGN